MCGKGDFLLMMMKMRIEEDKTLILILFFFVLYSRKLLKIFIHFDANSGLHKSLMETIDARIGIARGQEAKKRHPASLIELISVKHGKESLVSYLWG
jgi:hypothetical protein